MHSAPRVLPILLNWLSFVGWVVVGRRGHKGGHSFASPFLVFAQLNRRTQINPIIELVARTAIRAISTISFASSPYLADLRPAGGGVVARQRRVLRLRGAGQRRAGIRGGAAQARRVAQGPEPAEPFASDQTTCCLIDNYNYIGTWFYFKSLPDRIATGLVRC